MLLTMESKTAAHHKLELLIEKGRATAGSVVEHVMKNRPEDRLVRSSDLSFVANAGSTEVAVSVPHGAGAQTQTTQSLHRNALTQMAQATDLPLKFVDALQEIGASWGRELLAHNLNTIFQQRMPRHRYHRNYAAWYAAPHSDANCSRRLHCHRFRDSQGPPLRCDLRYRPCCARLQPHRSLNASGIRSTS